MFKYYIIAMLAVVLGCSIWLGVIYSRLGKANIAIGEAYAEIARKDAQITTANAAINIQNERIASILTKSEKDEQSFYNEQERIKKRYEYLLTEAQKKQSDNISCQKTLEIITQAQREFLYE